MQSDAPTVTEYMGEVPDDRRAALVRLRELCLETLEGYEETMAYGMPCYSRSGVGGVAFANQRRYVSLYVSMGVLDEQRETLAAAKIGTGKGCINFTRPDRIPFDLVRTMLVATMASDSRVQPPA